MNRLLQGCLFASGGIAGPTLAVCSIQIRPIFFLRLAGEKQSAFRGRPFNGELLPGIDIL